MANLKKKTIRTIYDRANGCCEYCSILLKYIPDPYVIEHIIPKSKGGSNELDNLALSCFGCNNHKYNKTKGVDPISEKSVVLFHPRIHKWKEHFRWDSTLIKILGISPIGRVTIEELKTNREELLNLRSLLCLGTCKE